MFISLIASVQKRGPKFEAKCSLLYALVRKHRYSPTEGPENVQFRTVPVIEVSLFQWTLQVDASHPFTRGRKPSFRDTVSRATLDDGRSPKDSVNPSFIPHRRNHLERKYEKTNRVRDVRTNRIHAPSQRYTYWYRRQVYLVHSYSNPHPPCDPSGKNTKL